jgi:hypothetical protein
MVSRATVTPAAATSMASGIRRPGSRPASHFDVASAVPDAPKPSSAMLMATYVKW